ncbi:hypothetical protein EYF80_039669 [Liparis tanakae]|uniref:Uncharacterized protein n=1 Tax=Liparis tanakae TaxID=230148 RepID=A0A4Z2GAM6_9TELE|nr:hypothetical protein EYF80_039669 [Liparis tanakae]
MPEGKGPRGCKLVGLPPTTGFGCVGVFVCSCMAHLPPSFLFPIAMRASRSVPFRPYCSSSLVASTFSGTRSAHSCRTHERLQILLWVAGDGGKWKEFRRNEGMK